VLLVSQTAARRTCASSTPKRSVARTSTSALKYRSPDESGSTNQFKQPVRFDGGNSILSDVGGLSKLRSKAAGDPDVLGEAALENLFHLRKVSGEAPVRR
jgi:hypothetical protein